MLKQINYFRFIKVILLIIQFCLLSNIYLFSQGDGDGSPVIKKRSKLKRLMSFSDEAIGVQTKGQLQNLTMNYGQISDTRYEDVGNAPTEVFFDFRYPRQNFTGLSDDFSLFFAIPENTKNGNQGNVIDGWTENDNEDWIAKDGSNGNTHYNPAKDPNPHAVLKWNNQTPYLAHSDLPDSWPVDASGNKFWPGWFRKDPKSGKSMINEFSSDRDIYMEFTDKNNQRGDVLGLEVHEMAYNYGRVYAEDFLIYEFLIINKSGKTLQNCWLGYYQDPDCSDYGEETLIIKDSTFADGSNVWSLMHRDFDGDIGGATKPNSLGITEDFSFGTVVLETPKNMGIKSFHYFVDPGPSDDSQLWPIITGDPTNKNISSSASQYFHGSNRMMDDVSTITTKQDLAWIIATGPFTMKPGDTVRSVVAVVAGDNDADYYSNVWELKRLYDAKFNGPIAPPAPSLSAVADDRKITLYWDDSPETSVDPATGVNDFEGYKIYRSEDGGVTWGKPITDSKGSVFGYVPVAQFDLKNNISGNDSKNPLIFLGNNTGLQHSWIDQDVINGKQYTYTIVSYDQGTPTLFSLESAKGDGTKSSNFITVVPLPQAQGKIPSLVKDYQKISGNGEGIVSIEVINENRLSKYDYEISFNGKPATSFNLTRLDASKTVLYKEKPVNLSDLPVVDGFRVSVQNDFQIGGIKSITDSSGRNVVGNLNLSKDSSWYVTYTINASADTLAKSNSYEIRFTQQGSIAYSWGLTGSVAKYNVPFEVWNISSNKQVCSEILDQNNNNSWNEGEMIYIVNQPYSNPSMGAANPAKTLASFAYQVGIINAPNDIAARPPTSGTVIRLKSYNAFRSDDLYRFKFDPSKFDNSYVDLSKVKVVPNPYIVTSLYETLQNVRQVRFMFLPSECKIYIYSVSGELLKTLYHNNPAGSLTWNLLTESNQALAYGVYVYLVEDSNGNKHYGKFALIK